MNQKSLYHDLSIIGIMYDSQQQRLFFQVKPNIENSSLLQFNSVVGWDLSPFEDQNILFDIQIFNEHAIPEWITTNFNIPKEYIDLVNSAKRKLFYIEASVGLGGYIIANEMRLA